MRCLRFILLVCLILNARLLSAQPPCSFVDMYDVYLDVSPLQAAYCIGKNIDFNVIATNTMGVNIMIQSGSFRWSYTGTSGSSTSSTGDSYSLFGILTGGIITITGNVTANGMPCAFTRTFTVVVDQLSDAGADKTVSTCQPQTLIGGSPSGSGGNAPLNYLWLPNSNFVSPSTQTSPNPTVNPTSTVVYTLEITDAMGCQTYDYMQVTVTPSQVANAGVDRTLTVCQTQTVIGGSPSGSGGVAPLTYSWSPNSNFVSPSTSSSANPTVNPTSGVIYTLQVTDAAGCKIYDYMQITVISQIADAGPDKIINIGQPQALIGGSPSGSGGVAPLTYSWSPAGSFVSPSTQSSANPTVNPTSSVIYTLQVTDANSCKVYDYVQIFFTSSYGELKKTMDGGYYQVTNGKLFFTWPEEYKNYTQLKYKIYDDQRSVRADYSASAPSLAVVTGDNRYLLDLSSGALGFTTTDNTKFFTLEVTNQKSELFLLKFKYAQ